MSKQKSSRNCQGSRQRIDTTFGVKLAELDSNGWLDSDDPLTDDDKTLIDRRLTEHEAIPQSVVSFSEYQAGSALEPSSLISSL